MIALKNLILNEPAVALGVLLAIAFIALKVANGEALTTQDLTEIAAPIASGLVVRQRVEPLRKKQRPAT